MMWDVKDTGIKSRREQNFSMPSGNWFIVRIYETAFILHDVILRDTS